MDTTGEVHVVASKDKKAKKQHFTPRFTEPMVSPGGQVDDVVPAPAVEKTKAIYPAPIAVQEAWERGDYAWIARALGVEEQLVGHYSLATLLVMAREKCRG